MFLKTLIFIRSIGRVGTHIVFIRVKKYLTNMLQTLKAAKYKKCHIKNKIKILYFYKF